MFSYLIEDIKSNVKEKVEDHHSTEVLNFSDIDECFEDIDPFTELHTEYFQNKFCVVVKLSKTVS